MMRRSPSSFLWRDSDHSERTATIAEMAKMLADPKMGPSHPASILLRTQLEEAKKERDGAKSLLEKIQAAEQRRPRLRSETSCSTLCKRLRRSCPKLSRCDGSRWQLTCWWQRPYRCVLRKDARRSWKLWMRSQKAIRSNFRSTCAVRWSFWVHARLNLTESATFHNSSLFSSSFSFVFSLFSSFFSLLRGAPKNEGGEERSSQPPREGRPPNQEGGKGEREREKQRRRRPNQEGERETLQQKGRLETASKKGDRPTKNRKGEPNQKGKREPPNREGRGRTPLPKR